ncbi:MAG: DUF3352 domain-containing protein [Rhodothermales bacterium]
MKLHSKSTLFLALVTLALGTILTACEPHQLQVFKEAISTQTKNAIDVLPADAAYVGMVNMQDLKSNEYTNFFGQNGLLKSNAPQEGLARLQDFIDITGFDPDTDLKEVYVASAEVGPDEKPAVSMVAYASIEQEELQSYVEDRLDGELKTSTYRGVEIFEVEEGNAPGFSFVNNNMIIAATSTQLLEEMIDRLEGKGTSLSSNDEMMALIGRASSGESGWLVAQKPEGMQFKSSSAGDDMEQSVRRIWSALDQVVVAMNVEASGVEGEVFFYPTADVSADDLSSLMNGMIALAKASPELDEEGLDMLDQIRASSKGDHVSVDISVDNTMIEKLK